LKYIPNIESGLCRDQLVGEKYISRTGIQSSILVPYAAGVLKLLA
jgi:hypothetical protein